MPRELSPAGEAFIKGAEELRLVAYDDKRPNYVLQLGDTVYGTLTIGWGHTGRDVFIGRIVTANQAEILFQKDIAPIVAALNKWLTWPTVRQCEFDAFCSFTFNLGIGALESSTVLKRYNYQGPVGDTSEAFLWWDEVNGKPDEAILERRKREQSMFLGNPAPYNPIS